MKEGYKKTEFGEIPVDWEVKKLDEFSISSSYGPRFSAELYDEYGNCRVIRGTDVIENGKVDYEGIPYANISNEVLEKHRLIENDFVVVTTADCGVSFVFDNSGVFMPSAYMVRIRFNDKISPHFVNKFFLTKFIKRQVEKHIRKGTIANLPGSDLLKFKICIPPILEQKKIAEILSTVDVQIDVTDKLIEKTKELKKGLMQRLLTKGIEHKEFKKSEVGEIPVEWEVVNLGNVVDIVNGGTPSTSILDYWSEVEIPWATPTDVTSGSKYIKSTERYISIEGLKNSSATLLPVNSILMTSRATIGEKSINTIPMATNQGFKSLICSTRIDNEFLYYYLDILKSYFISKSSGSTFLEISKKEVANTKIALPNVMEQRKIADILSSIDSQIEEYKNKKVKLEELKKGLMQQLLTGKLRVI